MINKQVDFANSITKGVCNYLNVTYVSESCNNTKLYKVQVGAFKSETNAKNLAQDLKSKGYDYLIVKSNGLYKVQVGAYKLKTNAEKTQARLKELGYNCFIL